MGWCSETEAMIGMYLGGVSDVAFRRGGGRRRGREHTRWDEMDRNEMG